jgi:TniQ
MSHPLPEPPLRRLPIDVRPTAGERAESYIRRLARANHLRPSYLRRYLSSSPARDAKIDPHRLAALTGRPAAILQQTLTARGWPQPPKPPSGYLRRRHADKPALYAQIRAAAQTGNPAKKELITQFRVCRHTLNKALAAPEPPPWKPPIKKRPPAYAAPIDALLAAAPELTTPQLWEQVLDHTDLKISYHTIAHYHRKWRRQAIPAQPNQHSTPPSHIEPGDTIE